MNTEAAMYTGARDDDNANMIKPHEDMFENEEGISEILKKVK